MSEHRCDKTGRRYRTWREDGVGPECREYAPSGPEGEGDSWPWRGRWCCRGDGGPRSIWYKLETIGFTPDGGSWIAWTRCNPPRGYEGLPVPVEGEETTTPLPVYDESDTQDTTPEAGLI